MKNAVVVSLVKNGAHMRTSEKDFIAKLADTKKQINYVTDVKQYQEIIQRLDPEQLFAHYSQSEDFYAMMMLLLPLIDSPKKNYFNILMTHLLGHAQQRHHRVVRHMNGTVSREFSNTVVHELIVNERWHHVQHILDSCQAWSVPMNFLIMQDKNQRTPFELILAMDTAPLSLIQQIFLVQINQPEPRGYFETKGELATTSDTHGSTTKSISAHIVKGLSLAYQNKNVPFMQLLKDYHHDVFQQLARMIDEENIAVLTPSEYATQLRSVCVVPERSHTCESNWLVIPVYSASNGHDLLRVIIKDQTINFISVIDKSVLSLKMAQLDHYSFFALSIESMPWDQALLEERTKAMIHTKSNIGQLWHVILPTETGFWPGEDQKKQVMILEGLHQIIDAWPDQQEKEKFLLSMALGSAKQLAEDSLIYRFNRRENLLSNKKVSSKKTINFKKEVPGPKTLAKQISGKSGFDLRFNQGEKDSILVGQIVEVSGLKTAVQYNGQKRQVVSIISQSSRLRIRLENGEFIQPPIKNCHAAINNDQSACQHSLFAGGHKESELPQHIDADITKDEQELGGKHKP